MSFDIPFVHFVHPVRERLTLPHPICGSEVIYLGLLILVLYVETIYQRTDMFIDVPYRFHSACAQPQFWRALANSCLPACSGNQLCTKQGLIGVNELPEVFPHQISRSWVHLAHKLSYLNVTKYRNLDTYSKVLKALQIYAEVVNLSRKFLNHKIFDSEGILEC